MVTGILERPRIKKENMAYFNLPFLEKASISSSKDGDTIPISEIFLSVQGEGHSVGTLQTFIRVAGCPFWEDAHPCRWVNKMNDVSKCDTAYAGLRSQGTEMTIDEILKKVGDIGCPSIFITGGEPLSYRTSIVKLSRLLYIKYGTPVEIQTNGSLAIWRDGFIRWSTDVKMKSSGNFQYNCWRNFDILGIQDQAKFVIANREDFESAVSFINSCKPQCQLFFQSAWNILNNGDLVEWMKNAKLWNVMLSTQVQKGIYGVNTRGV